MCDGECDGVEDVIMGRCVEDVIMELEVGK